MSFGIIVSNVNNNIQIDGDLPNYRKVSENVIPSGTDVNTIYPTFNYVIPTDGTSYVYTRMVGSSQQIIESSTGSNLRVIKAEPSSFSSNAVSEGWGLEVFNALSQKVFSSNEAPLHYLIARELTGSTNGGGNQLISVTNIPEVTVGRQRYININLILSPLLNGGFVNIDGMQFRWFVSCKARLLNNSIETEPNLFGAFPVAMGTFPYYAYIRVIEV